MTPREPKEPADVVRVAVRYVYWAHEPAAEDGHAPAEALCRRADDHPRKRGGFSVGTLEVPVDAVEEVRELYTVAKMWAIAEPDDDPRMRREARAVLQQIDALAANRLGWNP